VIKNQIKKDNKTLSQKSEKRGREKNLTKGNKRKEPKIKFLAHELLASILSYLMLAPWWYTNPLNLSSRTSHMSSLVVLCLSSYYQFVLLPHYELVLPWVSVAYVQTISNDVTRASPQLVHPSLSRMSSFRTRCLLVWSQIYRSMRISATLSC
jgi:hypothetical protein